MPLSFVAETLFRFLFEVVFYAVGYATGWLVVPILSLGYYTAEPLAPPRRHKRGHRNTPKDRQPRQLSAEATVAVGIVFWVAAGASIWWLTQR